MHGKMNEWQPVNETNQQTTDHVMDRLRLIVLIKWKDKTMKEVCCLFSYLLGSCREEFREMFELWFVSRVSSMKIWSKSK